MQTLLASRLLRDWMYLLVSPDVRHGALNMEGVFNSHLDRGMRRRAYGLSAEYALVFNGSFLSVDLRHST